MPPQNGGYIKFNVCTEKGRQCYVTFTMKTVENTTYSGVFLTRLEMFGKALRTYLFYISSQTRPAQFEHKGFSLELVPQIPKIQYSNTHVTVLIHYYYYFLLFFVLIYYYQWYHDFLCQCLHVMHVVKFPVSC